VQTGRQARLTIDVDTLSRAEIFTGVQALNFGLVDDLIATDEAIQRAADMAGLTGYDVVELYPLAFPAGANGLNVAGYRPPAIDGQRLWASPRNLPAGLYYRYVELPATH
jgi:ClpP class serine protease